MHRPRRLASRAATHPPTVESPPSGRESGQSSSHGDPTFCERRQGEETSSSSSVSLEKEGDEEAAVVKASVPRPRPDMAENVPIEQFVTDALQPFHKEMVDAVIHLLKDVEGIDTKWQLYLTTKLGVVEYTDRVKWVERGCSDIECILTQAANSPSVSASASVSYKKYFKILVPISRALALAMYNVPEKYYNVTSSQLVQAMLQPADCPPAKKHRSAAPFGNNQTKDDVYAEILNDKVHLTPSGTHPAATVWTGLGNTLEFAARLLPSKHKGTGLPQGIKPSPWLIDLIEPSTPGGDTYMYCHACCKVGALGKQPLNAIRSHCANNSHLRSIMARQHPHDIR